jgi:hypothetical protein
VIRDVPAGDRMRSNCRVYQPSQLHRYEVMRRHDIEASAYHYGSTTSFVLPVLLSYELESSPLEDVQGDMSPFILSKLT